MLCILTCKITIQWPNLRETVIFTDQKLRNNTIPMQTEYLQRKIKKYYVAFLKLTCRFLHFATQSQFSEGQILKDNFREIN